MITHFENRQAAVAHLIVNGWTQIENGNWVSPDKTCAASLYRASGDVVRIAFWEIHTA